MWFVIIIMALLILVVVWCVLSFSVHKNNEMLRPLLTESDDRTRSIVILTCTVSPHKGILTLLMKNREERLHVYLVSIRRWLDETGLTVVVVDNSGYPFPELEQERERHKERFEILSFEEKDLPTADFLDGQASKGTHEMMAIHYAILRSRFRNEALFWIKVTGRYFIPDLESLLVTKNMNRYYALRQLNPFRCEVVGAHHTVAHYVFFPYLYTHDTEGVFRKRISRFPPGRVLRCPRLPVPPTLSGGFKMRVTSL